MSNLQKQLFKRGGRGAGLARPPRLPGSIAEDDSVEEEGSDQFDALLNAVQEGRDVPDQGSPWAPVHWQDDLDGDGPFFQWSKDLEIPERKATFRCYGSGDQGPLYVFHHGAGHCALSFGCLSKAMMKRGSCRTLAYDCRRHADTTEANGEEQDLTLDVLGEDLVAIIQTLYPASASSPSPPILLVGHSMGAAIVTHVSSQSMLANIQGLIIIDVVEGTALSSLKFMSGIIDSRPKAFPSISHAIQFMIQDGGVHGDGSSAQLSTPPLLTNLSNHRLGWKTDLAATVPFWSEWFTGLSSKFLSCPTSKLLVLAGEDRLDKEMMVGQMQGKFQLEIFPESGHFIQEQCPEKLADLLCRFWSRQQAILPSNLPRPRK